ncbi:RAM signaling pathway protein-domain-containing protein [Multifurca ochricompacta]|uniref:RAM signaling pathway protein-domain-containing protein n=1 Tax=Multifurca ochricompacta TaxID=376703 RepID=A0AAD4QS21_9AGAM|nr:RAM signaling pathway protein-domain-containing protein [Multifurca ochricompacta]
MVSGGVDAQLSHRRMPSSPTFTTSLNHIHISEALLKSEDNGATLDFSHKGLSDVGEYGAEQLAAIGREDSMEDECSVLRVTLASNRLATLPMALALLSRLRYLNLKNNCLAVFPDVLTVMPSLEILDIGRNKIKRLPTQPGSLINLRVFSFYKNKITRLPSYLIKFTRLSIMRAEQNPWEWPPKSLMETQPTTKDFIKTVQHWIRDNTSSEYRKLSADSTLRDELGQESRRTNFVISGSQEIDVHNRPALHTRSFSISSTDSINLETPGPEPSEPVSSRSGPPPLLPLDPLSLSDSPPSRSPDTYLPTPEEFIDSSTDDDILKPISDTLAHGRTVSYAGSSQVSGRANLFSKKSLPDLRHIKLPPSQERPARSPVFSSIDQLRQGSSGSSDSAPITTRRDQASLNGDIASSPVSPSRPAPAMDGERHSYFRRFSILQSTAISKTIPDSLLRFVDAARGILFAVSQIYQALQHYTVYSIDERMASVLLKVLDPASSYITQLINALDRFDSMSRRTFPTPLVCRSIIESCKDNLAVFGKAVGVLALQLKVLATQDDVRYTRQMLLVLYGATAEISNAWQSMIPHLETVEPLLRDHRPPPVTKARPGGQSSAHPTSPSTTPVPPSPFPSFPPRPTFVPPGSPGPAERTHIARRHAGSFSSKDVEIGRFMASSDEPTIMQKGVASGTAAETPIPRVTRRHPGLLPLYSGSSLGTSLRNGSQSHDAHSRQGSLSSLVESPASSSPSVTGKLPVDIPTTLDSLVDKEAIDAMSKAVEAAPPVWTMMDSILVDIPENREDIKETLVKAQNVTKQLKTDISSLQDGTYVDRTSVRNDARLFVKLVVHLSTNVKSYVDSHPLSAALRANMVKLTNATEEFVILLHVSSFSNASTPRPHTPLVNGLSSNSAVVGAASEDTQLGENLTRSRSALAAMSRNMRSPAREVPHSALPQQVFRIPQVPLRPKNTTTEDALDGV